MTDSATIDTVLDALKANRAQIVGRMIETAETAPDRVNAWAGAVADIQTAIEAVEAHAEEDDGS